MIYKLTSIYVRNQYKICREMKCKYIFNCCQGTLNKEQTPWSRVIPEKLIVPQLVKEFLAFYGTQRFIGFTEAHH